MMAFIILLTVSGFFLIFSGNNVVVSGEKILKHYSELLVLDIGSPPDTEKAAELADSIGIEIRYESPDLSWATSDDLPEIAFVKGHFEMNESGHLSQGNRYFIFSNHDGSAYLIKWNFPETGPTHRKLLILLLLLVALAVIGAHFFIRHSLKPLKALRAGVVEISEGNLNVEVPVRRNDEFGSLTQAFNLMTQRVRDMIKARDQKRPEVTAWGSVFVRKSLKPTTAESKSKTIRVEVLR